MYDGDLFILTDVLSKSKSSMYKIIPFVMNNTKQTRLHGKGQEKKPICLWDEGGWVGKKD